MSDRFVSGGTIGASNETTASSGETSQSLASGSAENSTGAAGKKNAEWEAVQKELEADRQRREDERRKAAEGEEKSLYDILQANKAAKQAAFEEQTKVRNQFRALDDDEIDFLDEVRQKKKMEEEQVRRETEEGLKAFKNRQKDGPGELGEGEPGLTESWGVGRKRKRVKERDIKGVVKRRSSGGEEKSKGGDEVSETGEKGPGKAVKVEAEAKNDKPDASKAEEKKKKPSLGLVDYGSDDSD